MVSAGEASGDAHAAHALQTLKDALPDLQTFGMGAGELEKSGTELIVDCRDLAVIGFVDVLKNYHRFLQRLKTLREQMQRRKPDLLFLVDFPDFNLKLAETAKQLGIPVLFYVSPSVWAWRPKRIHRIGRLVDHMAVLFPFEVAYYERENIPVTYTGNPLVDDVKCTESKPQAQQLLGLKTGATTVALLPGSRDGELRRHLPLMLDAATQLGARYHDIQFVLPKAPTLERATIDQYLHAHNLNLTVTDGQAYTAMRSADVVICASGTATLETALIGTPMVLIYRLSSVNYQIMKRLIQIPDIGLVNIVAQRRIVPELVQHDATAARIAGATVNLLSDPEASAAQVSAFAEVRERLGEGGASRRVGALLQSMLEKA